MRHLKYQCVYRGCDDCEPQDGIEPLELSKGTRMRPFIKDSVDKRVEDDQVVLLRRWSELTTVRWESDPGISHNFRQMNFGSALPRRYRS